MSRDYVYKLWQYRVFSKQKFQSENIRGEINRQNLGNVQDIDKGLKSI